MEEWKVIDGYNNRYSVSNKGRVRNNETNSYPKLYTDKDNYKFYTLALNGKTKRHSLQQLTTQYWRYEWISELREGEEARRCLFDNRYFVTNHGRVWSNAGQKNGWLRAGRDKKYYDYVRIGNKTFRLHRLVARHFLPDFSEELDVCHIDEGLPQEAINRADNLFMGTTRDNILDALRKGRFKQTFTAEQVRQIRKKSARGAKQVDIAKEYGTGKGNIGNIIRGTTYQWVE